MPKVVFALRADARSKPGGDSRKITRYEPILKARGWQTQTVYNGPDLLKSGADIVHIVNLDLPLENLRYADIAKKTKAKLVLSTIRHPLAGLTDMYHHGHDRFYMKLRAAGIPADLGFALRERVKLLKRKNRAGMMNLGGYFVLQQRLLERVDAIFPMAESEAAQILEDFEFDGAVSVVPNGFTFREGHREAESRALVDAICVGRVEPRKNTLELARAATQAGVSVAFAGSINYNHLAYAGEFEQLVRSSSGLQYLGALDHLQLQERLRGARTYVNPAWVEVVSQADSEAAALGVPIVTTRNSYAADMLGPNVARFDPKVLIGERSSSGLQMALASAREVKAPTARSWDDAGAELSTAYAGLG